MNRVFISRVVLWLTLACGLLAGSVPTLAQSGVPAPPVRSMVDGNGVDLASGQVITGQTDVRIGPSGHHGLSFSRQWVELGWRYLEIPTMGGATSNPVVSFMGQSVAFKRLPDNSYEAELPNGATLNPDRTLFRGSDGTEIEFVYSSYASLPMHSPLGRPTKVTFPDGTIWSYHHHDASYTVNTPLTLPSECNQSPPPGHCANLYEEWRRQQGTFYNSRFASITSSTGFQIKLLYASDIPGSATAWKTLAEVKAINNAEEFCSPTASCTLSGTWPSASYTGTGASPYLTPATYTDPQGNVTTYTYTSYTSGRLSGIKPPGSGGNAITYSYTGGNVTSVAVAGVAQPTEYSFASGTTTVINPLLDERILTFDGGAITSDENELGDVTTYTYCGASETHCPQGLLKRVTAPEDNYVEYAYDARGNVIETRARDKDGVIANDIVTTAYFDLTCSNLKTCNQPVWTKDAEGNQTDYTYYAHGGLDTVTAPADANGIRPERRITYDAISAQYLTTATAYTDGPAFWAPVETSSCRVATAIDPASCVGTANELVQVIAYPTSGPRNAQPSSITSKLGDNTQAATTTVTYDTRGGVNAADGPLSGYADQTLYAYRDDGRLYWVIGPDPDDGGAAENPAVIYNYRPDGQLDFVQTGTVDNQPGGFTTWAELQRSTLTYDSYRRPIRETQSGLSAAVYQVTDVRYDDAGRILCTILRMDTANWGTPASSCSPPQTSDRVTYNHYDELGRTSQVTTGHGTDVAANEAISTFTTNGRLHTLTDAEGNMTTYEYDGHDRLARTYFPSPIQDGVSATCDSDEPSDDCEQISYDANGNVTSFVTRAGETFTLTYDNLNRLITKVVPNRSGNWCGLGSPSLCETHTRDVYYAYDLHGNMTVAGFDGWAPSDKIVSSFNPLGQLLDTTATMDLVSRKLAHQYDLAGNRTRLTYPDPQPNPYYIQYQQQPAGGLYQISLNGTAPLIYPSRDTAGRVNLLRRRILTPTPAWGLGQQAYFDNASRLSYRSLDLAGATHDGNTTFTYNAASQIASITQTNDLFSWSGPADGVDRSYEVNGLNQYTEDGDASLTYDRNGNLAAATNVADSAGYLDDYTFIYDAENRLIAQFFVNRSVGATETITSNLRYDPLGRLYEITDSKLGTTRRFLYDGDALVAEYDGNTGAMVHRYVHGPGAGDDPLVWFEGSGVGDAARRYLFADERGSIIAVSEGDGDVLAVNSYDEYGVPASSNIGAFQYTGQVWLPELGMYYYKARMYSPSLGRFMQTDPIGYGDGMNMYAYVGGDPVNGVDPTGMWADPFGGNGGAVCQTGSRICGGGGGYATYSGAAASFFMSGGGGSVGGFGGGGYFVGGGGGRGSGTSAGAGANEILVSAQSAPRFVYTGFSGSGGNDLGLNEKLAEWQAAAEAQAWVRYRLRRGSVEVSYSVLRNARTKAHKIVIIEGEDGSVRGAVGKGPWQTILMGHIHNNRVYTFLGFPVPGRYMPGPSWADGANVRGYPNIPHILHENVNGSWIRYRYDN